MVKPTVDLKMKKKKDIQLLIKVINIMYKTYINEKITQKNKEDNI